MIKGIMSNASAIKGIMSKEFSAIRCLDFNGSTDWVDCGSSPITGTQAFTLEAWLKTSVFNEFQGAVSIGDRTPYKAAYIGTVVTAQVGISYSIGGGFWGRNYGSGITSTGWVHVIMTFSGGIDGTAKIYVNLVEKTVDTYTPDISSNTMVVGRIVNSDSYYINALVCMARIYKNKALDEIERQNNFNGKITQDGLVAEWLMREQQGNILHDTSVNTNHGTIYGADWYEEKFNTPLKGIMSNSSEITGIMTAEYI